ncbi:MAG TPA: hypothetical protein VLS88_14455 [Polyangiales bacterium]|nr:hypothetical protein [Polyangiales bacterium]
MLEPMYMLVAFVFSSVGFVMLVYGKKQQRPLQLGGGLLLLLLPFFLHDALRLGLISAALCAAVWLGVKAGY